MIHELNQLLAAFIPLFVSIDAFGLVPIFLSLTHRLDHQKRRRVTFEGVFFALSICLAFMLLGNAIFGAVGISTADFKIAGGILLLVLAIIDLLIPGKPAVDEHEAIGIFPLAMPLIAGPATLTTTLVLAGHNSYGYAITAIALILNFSILLVALLSAPRLARLVGGNAMRALSKLVMVLLAAIAVNLIRTGIVQAWIETPPH